MDILTGQLKVSIVTVSYNSAKTIEQTIKSVINQTYSNIEYIVIDGGSTDGTVDIIKKYEDRIAYWVSEPDDGIFDAMNKGIKIATGEVVGIINSDDWYENNAVEIVAREFCCDKNMDILVGNVYYRDYHGNILDVRRNGSLDKYVKKVMPINHPGMFVRREVYRAYGGYDVEFPLASDYEFICRMYKLGCIVNYNKYILSNFRENGATSTFDSWKGLKNCFRLAKEEYRIQEKHFQHKNVFRTIMRCVFSIIKFILAKCKLLHKVTQIKRKYIGRWI